MVRSVYFFLLHISDQIGLLEEQWELTEGQKSHNLSVNSVDSTHEDNISVKETKSSRAV